MKTLLKKEKVIIFNLSGHGMMDLLGYDKYMHGQLSDYEMSEKEISDNLHQMDGYPKP